METLKREITALEDKIEKMRKKMYDVYMKDPKDPDVVVVSQELDKLLNNLMDLINKQNARP
ncbi:aspartyl-phosphate phosphatase Spo0E family protein [Thalassobacillus hwangdonensis]|uniref:Aspartyl-phosphate phosphatase Spo0E family protein n=1 Tax=Thalassobacillus hwangdonensis TaxID=546108 RepID=A0ABW3KZ92_9BACI